MNRDVDLSVMRILDANLNRAREGLRVIEDYARFAMDDPAGASQAKQIRHDLRRIADEIGATALLAARDVDGDVGREAKTSAELARDDAEGVVKAAFARLSEATRALGEYGKLVSQPAAARAEAIRYCGYELEQRIVLRGRLRKRFAANRLYVIVTESLCRRDWLATAEAAIRGGAGCVQLREKGLSDAELLAWGRKLRDVASRLGALLIVNDRPEIARLSGADGVHVGQDDLSVRDARRIAGGQMLVGKSTHTMDQFIAALDERPDYIAVGPMFQTSTKPQAHVPGPVFLRIAAETIRVDDSAAETNQLAGGTVRTTVPIVAIGGVTAETSPQLIASGAASVCVCSAVVSSNDPETAARRIVDAINATLRQ